MEDYAVTKEMVKAGQEYRDADGVIYTVLSNRLVKKLRDTWRYEVTAYTFDLSVSAANGHLNGRRCHFADANTPVKFLNEFSRV